MTTTKTLEERIKAANLAIAGLEKEFGPGIVFSGTDDIVKVDVVPTNNFKLDLALGVGGFPRGRITEIAGPEGLGKTLIGLNAVAMCQEAGGLAAYIDVEHALDPFWATKNGVKWSDLYLSQPDSAEQVLKILRTLVRSGAYDLIIVDSVAAMTPQHELDGEIGDSHVAGLARLMSQAMRMLKADIAASHTCVIFMNQVRENINTMGMGPKTTTPGGRALRFYASVRIELVRLEQIKDKKNGELLGNVVQAKIIKNKVAPPFKIAQYPVIHGKGFDNEVMILDLGRKYGAVMLSGAYYYRIDKNGERDEKPMGQGEANATRYLRDNPDVRKELMDRITEAYKRDQAYFDMPEDEVAAVLSEEDEIGEPDTYG